MIESLYNVLCLVWNSFFRFPLPFGKDEPVTGEMYAEYARAVVPAAGGLIGLVLWLAAALMGRIAGHAITALLAAVAIPLVQESLMKTGGFRALSTFSALKSQGLTLRQVLSSEWPDDLSLDSFTSKTFISVAAFCFFRAGLYAILAFSAGGLWFLFAWTGVFFLYADLSSLPERISGESFFPVSEKHPDTYIFVTAAVFLLAGLLSGSLLSAFTAFLTTFALSRLAGHLQRKSANGTIDESLMAFYGICMECSILLLGAVISA